MLCTISDLGKCSLFEIAAVFTILGMWTIFMIGALIFYRNHKQRYKNESRRTTK